MLVTVKRTDKTFDGIFGTLSIDKSPFTCYTEENLADIIPSGMYSLLFMWSDHFQQIMPHVIVPGRTAIEIHWANYPTQLAGCTALGTSEEIAADAIEESKIAWIGFAKAITDQPILAIQYLDNYT